MKNEPDFSGINPLRVKAARQRLTVVERYLALPEKTGAEKLAAASSIGLTPNAFQRLINRWQKYKDVNKLVVNGKLPTRNKKLHPSIREMISKEIEKAGHTASGSKIHQTVVKRCRKKGIKAPSLPAAYNILMESRSKKPELVGGHPRVVIGRLWFKIPMRDSVSNDVSTRLAQVLAAVALPERVIVAHVISVTEADPTIPALLEKLVTVENLDGPYRPLVMDRTDQKMNEAAISKCGLAPVLPFEFPTQKELKRAFGTQLGLLTPFYRSKLLRPAAENLLCRQDQPLTEHEAQHVIEAAIADNNVKWTKPGEKLEFKLRQ